MLAIKRKMRERSEERVAHSQKYMQSNARGDSNNSGLLRGGFVRTTRGLLRLRARPFSGTDRPREPERSSMLIPRPWKPRFWISWSSRRPGTGGEDIVGTKPELVERLVNARWAAYEAAQPAPAPAPVDITPMVDARSPVRAVIISCHDDHDSKDLRRGCGVLVARRPHLARPKTQYVLAKDPELPPFACFRFRLRRAERGPGPGAGSVGRRGHLRVRRRSERKTPKNNAGPHRRRRF